ncbi:MAG: UpxY family transcription antiterminator [Tannerella sp.]|jgi:transcription antitermination factor NusG|nr:UpxY family transcription antiterminator [Tannerella sp.]
MTNPQQQQINWYAFYTTPRAEKRVLERLEGEGVTAYLPLHRTPRVWSDRIKLVDLPLFSSYVFVKCKAFELFQYLKISGISRIVFYDGKPAVIRQSEIDAMAEFLEVARGKTLATGDEVEILTGSMKKKAGKILKIKKKYVFLRIDQLAATVCVNIESIAPLNRIK